MRIIAGILATTLLLAGAALAVDDPDELLAGKVTVIKHTKLAKFVGNPTSVTPLPSATNAPTISGGTLRIFDTGQLGNSDSYTLAASGWSRIPKKETKPLKGYKFKGEPCKSVIVKADVVKAKCKGDAIQLDTPFAGNVGIIMTLGPSSKRYCASFGGGGKNDDKQVNRTGAAAPASCPVPFEPTTTTSSLPPTTTSLAPTTSTSLRATTTTSTSSTTSTTIFGETTTTTIVGETTTTTILGETTTTTITGETTTTTIGGGCCNGDSFLNFSTTNTSGDCGDIINAAGTLVANVNCAGLYTGGGGNSVPLPYAVPDQGSAVTKITTCTGSVATIGEATSSETGSNLNCSAAGCRFGAPLAVPNPGSTPTSVCVLNNLSSGATGTVDCSTGATDISAPLASVLFLTGDTATDPGSTIAGIQPCPLCTGSSCIGGPNNGMSCTAGTSTLGGNPAYPTSNDCPPDPMFNIGTLPVNFSLTSGTVSWTGTTATNDSGSTTSAQSRVFSGFCRDTAGTGAFAGTTPATAELCWENGMAVGSACSGTFESCEQRSNGAFGPAGGNNKTITAIGSAASIIGGPAAATLVSVFSIRPTFDPTVDAAGDLPGPGAVALPGTAQSCATANPCP